LNIIFNENEIFKKIFHLNIIIIVRINVRIILRNIEIENFVIFLYNIFPTAIYIIQMCNNSKLYSGVRAVCLNYIPLISTWSHLTNLSWRNMAKFNSTMWRCGIVKIKDVAHRGTIPMSTRSQRWWTSKEFQIKAKEGQTCFRPWRKKIVFKLPRIGSQRGYSAKIHRYNKTLRSKI